MPLVVSSVCRGISAVHYLIFSDNIMVRRAAVEALCNMPMHEGVLSVSTTSCHLSPLLI